MNPHNCEDHSSFDFTSAVLNTKHVIHHFSFFPHGLIRIYKWPAHNVSGFITQLVRASHRYREVTGSNPVEVLNFSGFYIRNCINCVHNCEDHSLLDHSLLAMSHVGVIGRDQRRREHQNTIIVLVLKGQIVTHLSKFGWRKQRKGKRVEVSKSTRTYKLCNSLFLLQNPS